MRQYVQEIAQVLHLMVKTLMMADLSKKDSLPRHQLMLYIMIPYHLQ